MANFIDLGHALAASSSLVQYSVITLTSANTVKASTAVAAATVHGILQNAPTSTAHTASYRVVGESLVRPTSDAVVVGALLVAATAGKCQSATASSAQSVFGIALTAAAASTGRGANDVIRAFVNFPAAEA